MKKSMLVTLCAVYMIAVSFIPSRDGQFTIIGSVSGFADSTFLYLDQLSVDGSRKHLDSTYVIGEKFAFSGRLQSAVIRAVITTRKLSDYKFFWLENARITFQADNGKLKDAMIAGSKTQEEQEKLDEALKIPGKKKEQTILFIQRHPASMVSGMLLSTSGKSLSKDTLIQLYNHLSPAIRNSPYGKIVSDFISFNKNVKIGDSYADFAQRDTGLKNVRLSDFKGKVVLLEFWGSWCTPCRQGNPELVRIYNDYKNKGFDILGVGVETNKNAWRKAIDTDGLPWTNVSDLKGDKNEAVLIYGVTYFPSNYLIDRSGLIIAKDLHGEKLRQKLDELLATHHP